MAPDLGLDLKLSVSKIVTNFSKQASSIDDEAKRIAKLEEIVRNLEVERRKIEAFKWQLPLCIFLLDDVIDGVNDELEQCRREMHKVLKEFMPIKSKFEEEEGGVNLEKDCKDKMNWMSSAQLWSDNSSDNNNKSETPSIESKSKRFGRAFVPFNAISCSSRSGGKVPEGSPDLSLVSAVVAEDRRSGERTVSKPIRIWQAASSDGGHGSSQLQQQGPRKARRSWSPELHQGFVAALQKLGGAQVATPKQIRELMKVDGLTNDEVKSHLQKYRFHTRRVNDSSLTWPPQEQKYTPSGSPLGPLDQLAAGSSSRAVSVTNGESYDEDAKSESCNWK